MGEWAPDLRPGAASIIFQRRRSAYVPDLEMRARARLARLIFPSASTHREAAAGRRRRCKPVFACTRAGRRSSLIGRQRSPTGLSRRSRSAGLAWVAAGGTIRLPPQPATVRLMLGRSSRSRGPRRRHMWHSIRLAVLRLWLAARLGPSVPSPVERPTTATRWFPRGPRLQIKVGDRGRDVRSSAHDVDQKGPCRVGAPPRSVREN